MGSIPELGNWEDFKCGMTKTKNDYWITEDLRINSASYFQYKYVMVNNIIISPQDSEVVWEQGLIRIADLGILPQTNMSKGLGVISVQLFDEWEYFTIKFGILYPSQSYAGDKRILRINGSRDELGNWLTGKGPLLMTQSSSQSYKNVKNGQIRNPWEIYVRMKNNFEKDDEMK